MYVTTLKNPFPFFVQHVVYTHSQMPASKLGSQTAVFNTLGLQELFWFPPQTLLELRGWKRALHTAAEVSGLHLQVSAETLGHWSSVSLSTSLLWPLFSRLMSPCSTMEWMVTPCTPWTRWAPCTTSTSRQPSKPSMPPTTGPPCTPSPWQRDWLVRTTHGFWGKQNKKGVRRNSASLCGVKKREQNDIDNCFIRGTANTRKIDFALRKWIWARCEADFPTEGHRPSPNSHLMPSQNCLLFHIGPSCSYFSFVILLNLLSLWKITFICIFSGSHLDLLLPGDPTQLGWCSQVLLAPCQLFLCFAFHKRDFLVSKKVTCGFTQRLLFTQYCCQWNVRAEAAAPQHLICLAVFDHGCNSTAFPTVIKRKCKVCVAFYDSVEGFV